MAGSITRYRGHVYVVGNHLKIAERVTRMETRYYNYGYGDIHFIPKALTDYYERSRCYGLVQITVLCDSASDRKVNGLTQQVAHVLIRDRTVKRALVVVHGIDRFCTHGFHGFKFEQQYDYEHLPELELRLFDELLDM